MKKVLEEPVNQEEEFIMVGVKGTWVESHVLSRETVYNPFKKKVNHTEK
jgi:hypothetical protein